MNRPPITAAVIAAQRGYFTIESKPREGMPTMPNPALAYTVQAELMQLGYMLDERAFSVLQTLTNEEVIRYHDEVVAYARYIKGDGAYRPLYSGFPQQVMELSDIELFWNAVCHYMSNGTWEPNAYTVARPTAFEHPTYKVLTPCSFDEFIKLFSDILSVNQSITPMDKEALQWFVGKYGRSSDFRSMLPAEIPFKENLSYLLFIVPVGALPYTLTDILRMATYLSEGDVSLAASTKFRLTGAMRRKVMQMLEHYVTRQGERTGEKFLQSLEDMKRHRGKWLALLSHIHADSKPFRKKFPEAQRIVNLIRWHEKRIPTWNSLVENAADIDEQLRLLGQRPGELARRLNGLLRREVKGEKAINGFKEFKDYKVFKDSKVLKVFAATAPSISNKVLFELFGYFEGRRERQRQRTVFVKGSRKPVQLTPQEALPGEVVDEVQRIILAAIWRKLAAWPPMGDVIIDERLKNIPLPTNMRTVSETDVPVVRGTHLSINGKADKTIRFYVHWDDPHGTEDLDLSATFIGLGKMERVAWNCNYCLKGFNVPNDFNDLDDLNDAKGVIAIHSGDVRHRKGACAEYIDLIPANAVADGYRYVLIDVRNFNGRSLKSLNPAFGYMEREHLEANPQWVPNTVVASMRLQSEAVACIAVMVDLETMEYIPLDIDSSRITATRDTESLLSAMRQYMEPPRLSVYDLINWHVQARGGRIVEEDFKEDKSLNGFKDSKGSKDLNDSKNLKDSKGLKGAKDLKNFEDSNDFKGSKDFEGFEAAASPTHFRFEDFATSYIEVLKLMADSPPPL